MSTPKTILASLAVFLMLMLGDSYAPPTSGGATSGGGSGCWPPPCVPIDGGIALLAAAGALVAGRSLWSAAK